MSIKVCRLNSVSMNCFRVKKSWEKVSKSQASVRLQVRRSEQRSGVVR